MPLTLKPALTVGRLVAAATLAAAAGLAVPLTPANAAACPAGEGVTVVVEFASAGGGTVTSCVADGGGNSAAEQFADAGHSLERVQRFPGAICKVDGKPGSASCVNMPPSNAYWALYWKKAGGSWAYSSAGVDSLDIPEGGAVRFTWKGSASAPEEPEPEPPGGGSGGGSGGGNGGGGNGGGSGGATPDDPAPTASDTPSASASPKAEKSATGTSKQDDKGKKSEKKQQDKADAETDEPSVTPEASTTAEDAAQTEDTEATSAEPPADSDDGLPVWVAPVGIAVLFAAAGATALVRRRSAP